MSNVGCVLGYTCRQSVIFDSFEYIQKSLEPFRALQRIQQLDLLGDLSVGKLIEGLQSVTLPAVLLVVFDGEVQCFGYRQQGRIAAAIGACGIEVSGLMVIMNSLP